LGLPGARRAISVLSEAAAIDGLPFSVSRTASPSESESCALREAAAKKSVANASLAPPPPELHLGR